jgi:hypothetical protein
LGGSGSVAVFVSQIVTAQLINLARQDRSRPQTPSLPARLTTTALRRQRTSLLFEASSAMRPKLTRLQSPTRIPAAALRVCEAPYFLGEEREGGGFLPPPACPIAWQKAPRCRPESMPLTGVRHMLTRTQVPQPTSPNKRTGRTKFQLLLTDRLPAFLIWGWFKVALAVVFEIIGAPEEIRTPDPQIRSLRLLVITLNCYRPFASHGASCDSQRQASPV